MTVLFQRLLSMKLRWLIVTTTLLVLPWTLQNAFLQHVLVVTLIFYILLLGLNIVIGLTGQVALCHAALYGVGAYTSAILAKEAFLSFWLSLPLAVAVSACLGFFLSTCVVKMRAHYLALATIGFGEVLINVFRSADKLTGGANGLSGIPSPIVGRWVIDSPLSYYYVVLLIVALCYLGMITIMRSQLGIALRAVRDNEIAASSLGINTVRLKVLAFTLSAAYAGAAGALYAHFDGFIGPESFSTSQSILLFCVLVVGGSGRPLGPLVGAVLFVIGQEFFRSFSQYQLMLFGSTVILVMSFAPEGIVGLVRPLLAKVFGISKKTSAAESETWDPSGMEDAISDVTNSRSLKATGPSKKERWRTNAIMIEDLVVRYGGVTSLDRVSFNIRGGEIFCLIGPNGAGKTTLLNVIGGQQRPAEGRVMLSPNLEAGVFSAPNVSVVGHRPDQLARLGLARTFQTSQLFSELSVLENVLAGEYQDRATRPSFSSILFAPWLAIKKDAVARTAAESQLRLTHLTRFRHQPSKQLPYGLRRVLEIARCLATNPRVLLLDEPSAGMNPTERKALAGLLRHINDLGVTLMIVAHDLELVRDLANHVVVLDHGKVIFDGSPAHLRQSTDVVHAYLGKRKMEAQMI
jgi:ABC-type branched-subunit amino acid transport system permease subunit/ABC-type branched-subunit amino acid transport system ATPase component